MESNPLVASGQYIRSYVADLIVGDETAMGCTITKIIPTGNEKYIISDSDGVTGTYKADTIILVRG